MSLTITNEDNMLLMARYPDNYFDLAIVDPPYRSLNQPTKEMRHKGSMETIKDKPTKEYFKELFRISKSQIIWGSNNFELTHKGFIVWDKCITGVQGKYSDCELAFISENLGTTSKIFKYAVQNVPEKKIHPTQKPVQLYKWILKNYAQEGFNIIDTHLGSGSIAIAVEEMNRFEKMNLTLTACEIDKEYYTDTTNRINNHVAQQSLF